MDYSSEGVLAVLPLPDGGVSRVVARNQRSRTGANRGSKWANKGKLEGENVCPKGPAGVNDKKPHEKQACHDNSGENSVDMNIPCRGNENVGLYLKMGSGWPSSQTFHSSERKHKGSLHFNPTVEDAEGLDKEQVAEDVTGGNRSRGPSNKDITTRWTWVQRNAQHTFLLP